MIQMDLSHIRQFIPPPYEEARAAQLRLPPVICSTVTAQAASSPAGAAAPAV